MSLPRVVYVYRDQDTNGSSYLVASTSPDDQDEGVVGVYDLRETLHVRHRAEFKRHRTKTWFKSAE